MNKYHIIRFRFYLKRAGDGLFSIHEDIVGECWAVTPESAVQIAKHLGFHAPIIAPAPARRGAK